MNEQCPPSIPTNHKSNDDNGTDETGDYGIILVKKYKNLRSSAVWDKASNDGPNHRGIRPTQENKRNGGPEGLIDQLTSIFCGACVSEKYVLHEDPSAASTVVSEDFSTKSGSDSRSNAILLRQNQFKEEEQKQQHEESILTDVSFLTDGSPRDLELRGVDEAEMPNSSNSGVAAKTLPAFRKPPVMRKSQRGRPMPPDLSKHTRKNPLWTNKMGTALKKTYDKRRKSSSSSKRKKRYQI